MKNIISKTDQKNIIKFRDYLNNLGEAENLFFTPVLTVFSDSIEIRWSIYHNGFEGENLISSHCTKSEVLDYLENNELY